MCLTLRVNRNHRSDFLLGQGVSLQVAWKGFSEKGENVREDGSKFGSYYCLFFSGDHRGGCEDDCGRQGVFDEH